MEFFNKKSQSKTVSNRGKGCHIIAAQLSKGGGSEMFTKQKFADWNLDSSILTGLKELGWEYATQVQKDTIPLARKD